MGFAKGSISLSPSKDIPMLLQVLHAQFITQEQLREFALLQGYEVNYGSFNWRLRRLVENGLLERHSVPGVTASPIYSITNVGKHILAEHFPVMDSHRHKDAASHVNLIHSLELNRLHLRLEGQDVLVKWESEMTIRAKNELTCGGYVKNYDAIVTVNLHSRQLTFALEYERSPKKPRTYARIRSPCYCGRSQESGDILGFLKRKWSWNVMATGEFLILRAAQNNCFRERSN